MLEAGEDVAFIARRLVIFASEDVGNAAPMALVVSQAAADAVRFIGMPEAALTLSQAVTFLADAPKSRLHRSDPGGAQRPPNGGVAADSRPSSESKTTDERQEPTRGWSALAEDASRPVLLSEARGA